MRDNKTLYGKTNKARITTFHIRFIIKKQRISGKILLPMIRIDICKTFGFVIFYFHYLVTGANFPLHSLTDIILG